MNRYFKSENFLAGIIMLALLNNIEHVSTTYYQLSRKVLPVWEFAGLSLDMNAIQAVLAILILDFAIIAFVVRGKHKIAGLYAAALFAVQLFYPIDFTADHSSIATWIATILFAGMFSYTIYEFSKLYSVESDQKEHEKEKERLKAARERQKLAESQHTNSNNKSAPPPKKAASTGKKIFACDKCDYVGASQKALNAHMKAHVQAKASKPLNNGHIAVKELNL
jgi:hypothetical protein